MTMPTTTISALPPLSISSQSSPPRHHLAKNFQDRPSEGYALPRRCVLELRAHDRQHGGDEHIVARGEGDTRQSSVEKTNLHRYVGVGVIPGSL